MAIPKYKKQYEDMIENNQELFDSLKTLPKKSEDFKSAQRAAMRIVRKNEDLLCKRTENTKFTNFSTNLADKFTEEVQTNYPEVYIL